MPIGLLIADDHAGLRAGLRHTFERTDITVVAEATTASEALCFALNERVQAVLLDVSWVHDELGGTSQAGIDLLAEIRSVRPELPVLMYSSHDTAALRERCRHLGAGG